MAWMRELARLPGGEGSRVLARMLAGLSVEEKVALAAHWSFWARPKQRPPEGNWKTWGFLAGRAFGKTRAVSEHILGEIIAGRADLTGVAAQDEANAVAVQILGPSGLFSIAPPWFRPEWVPSEMKLRWPNGASTFVRTPEVPGKIRGLEYHLFWATEIQSWPAGKMLEAFSNVEFSTRLGYGRIVWDATAKRRHPILKRLLANAERDPVRHYVVRGSTHENAINLSEGFVEGLAREYEGTSKGREELHGEMLDDAEGALWKSLWFERTRVEVRPEKFLYKCISIDPAVSTNKGSDNTGIVLLGLGVDGKVYVCADESGKHAATQWAERTFDVYEQEGCDFIIAERNKGGDLVMATLRAIGQGRGLNVIETSLGERRQKMRGVVYVMEVYAQGSKADRAEPVATAYEGGRVCHVGNLEALETTLTTWEPDKTKTSPGDLDALVHGVIELLALREQPRVRHSDLAGIAAAAKRLQVQQTGAILNKLRNNRGRI